MLTVADAADPELSRTAGTDAGIFVTENCPRKGAPLYEVDRFGTMPDWFSVTHFETALREQLPDQSATRDGLFDMTSRAEQDRLMGKHSGIWLLELFPSQARIDVSLSGRCADKAVPVTIVGSYEPRAAPALIAAPTARAPEGDIAAMAAQARADELRRLAVLKQQGEIETAEASRAAQVLLESTLRIQKEATADFSDLEDLIDEPAALFVPPLQAYLDKYSGANVSVGDQTHSVDIAELQAVQRAVRRIQNGNLRTKGQRQRTTLQLSGLGLTGLGAAGLAYAYHQRGVVVQNAEANTYTRDELVAAVRRTNTRIYSSYGFVGAGLVLGGAVPLFIPTGSVPRIGLSTRW